MPCHAQAAAKAKTIKVCKNGDAFFPAQPVLVPRARCASLGNFCDQITGALNAAEPVHRLYTPNHGTRVAAFGDLVDGMTYVAAPNKRFRKLDYGGIVDLRTQERLHRRSGRSVFVPPNRSLGWSRSLGRDGVKPPVKLATSRHIFLIRNGDRHAEALGYKCVRAGGRKPAAVECAIWLPCTHARSGRRCRTTAARGAWLPDLLQAHTLMHARTRTALCAGTCTCC